MYTHTPARLQRFWLSSKPEFVSHQMQSKYTQSTTFHDPTSSLHRASNKAINHLIPSSQVSHGLFFLTDKNKASSRKCLVSWATPIYCAVWHCTVVTDIYKDYQLKWSSKSQWHMERTLSTGKYWTFWIRFNHARMYKPNNGHTMVIRFKQGMQLLTPPGQFQGSNHLIPVCHMWVSD